MTHFTLTPRGPFLLSAIREFGCGLMVASRECPSAANEVRLAFPLDGTHQAVGVRIEQTGPKLKVTVAGTDQHEVVRRQLERILSLDHDGEAYAALLASDPVLTAAAKRSPGFRPPVFYSPYAAAGWLVLGHRVRRAQATKWQGEIARACGDVITVDGVELASFPQPESFLSRRGFEGIPEIKWTRLQAVARAAINGQLELERLVSRPYSVAHAALTRIHGVGPWTADGILFRGAGLADAFITSEPQIHHAVQLAYGLASVPDDDALERVAQTWRPFRTWVSVLLTMQYYQATDGVAPTLRKRGAARKRAA